MQLNRFLPVIIFLGIFLSIVYFTPPPNSWADASVIQILSFFLPLVLFLTFLLHLFMSFGRAFSISLGVMVYLVLSSTYELNLVTITITLALTIILVFIFQRVGLTTTKRVPKLTRFKGKKR